MYDRTTRFVDFAAMYPPLRDGAQRVATAQGIGELTTAARQCVETHSRRTRAPGLLARLFGGGEAEHWTLVVLTRDAVLAGTHGEKRGTSVFFLPLATLELDDVSVLEAQGPAIGLKSPSLARGSGVGSYPVFFDSAATRDRVVGLVRGALAERRG